jgi:hypothetical protein
MRLRCGRLIFAGIVCLVTASPRAAPAAATARDGSHDFDFNLGVWKTHVARLVQPLSRSKNWANYDGTSVVRPFWHGKASVFELEVTGPAGRIEGVGVRLYNPQTRQWSLNWASSRTAAFQQPPTLGAFRDGRGEFTDHETYDGKPITVRNRFLDIAVDSSRFEQAFSADNGRTWQTNWIMTFARKKNSAASP